MSDRTAAMNSEVRTDLSDSPVITEQAYAKINPALDITGRLENGYHKLDMLMQQVQLWDTLEFTALPGDFDPETHDPAQVVLTIGGADLSAGDDNLVVKAARRILTAGKVRQGVRIRLTKRIPMAAGLAGGSADAAATLRGIVRLFDLDIPEEELLTIAVKLGADVPYCLRGGLMRARGIGEVLTPVNASEGEDPSPVTALLIKPPFGISTAAAYQAADALEAPVHPDIPGMIRELEEGRWEEAMALSANVLEQVAQSEHPEIREMEDALLQEGAFAAAMSGSGPTVFGLFREAERAEGACRRFRADPHYADHFVGLAKLRNNSTEGV